MVLRCEQAHGRSLGSGGVCKVASPRFGDCEGGFGGSCVLLPASDEWVGGAGWPGVCAAEWSSGAIVHSAW